jgi:hypothetical protein
MGKGDREAELMEEVEQAKTAERFRDGRVTASECGDDVLEALAIDAAHDERDLVVYAAKLVDRDDAGVLELTRDLGLLQETNAVEVAERRLSQDLHRHRPAEVQVPSSQDAPHGAARDLLLNLVARGHVDEARDQVVDRGFVEANDCGRGAREPLVGQRLVIGSLLHRREGRQARRARRLRVTQKALDVRGVKPDVDQHVLGGAALLQDRALNVLQELGVQPCPAANAFEQKGIVRHAGRISQPSARGNHPRAHGAHPGARSEVPDKRLRAFGATRPLFRLT